VSLRDQLLAKGLVSKKRARALDRESKKERRRKQGSKKKRRQLEAEAEAEAASAAEAHESRMRQRREAAQAHEAHEHRFRVRDIVRNNRLAVRGPIPFHFRIPGTDRVGTMFVSLTAARELRVGRAAIAGFQELDDAWTWMVVAARAAQKLETVEPGALGHWVTDNSHLTDPSEGLLQRTWESQLGPHRVRDEAELAALRERELSRSS
jgi:uncharacterized protein YaiL (DUF2058 family)